MSISQARARQIIKEEVARALRSRRLSEMGGMHGHMEDAAYEGAHEGAYEGDVYEVDETMLDDDYTMEGDYAEGEHYEGDYSMELDMEEGQHDNDQGGQHDNDLGAGDDALMESLRRRLLGRKARR